MLSYYFLKHPTVLYTGFIIDEINESLSTEERINILPFYEEQLLKVSDLLNEISELDKSFILDNYNLIQETTEKLEWYKPRIRVYSYPKFKPYFKIKLSNYNNLSDKVPDNIKKFVFEVVDYFKRYNITNFDGYIEFVKSDNKVYVYKLEVIEKEL